MATAEWIESAATRPDTWKPAINPEAVSATHLLHMGPGDQSTEEVTRRRASRALVRFGRTAEDPDADLLLEACGLSHNDAIPEVTHARVA